MFDIDKKQGTDGWEIPFEIISGTEKIMKFILYWYFLFAKFFQLLLDIEWIGSGAQGAVFSGKINNKVVAIKKVKELHETNIKHLSKLDHDNIVKFLWVCFFM